MGEAEEGALAQPLTGLHRRGLHLPTGLTYERWVELVSTLGALAKATPWAIGDALTYGEAAYGEKYAQGAEAFGLEPGTLMTYAWVARSFQISRRREKLEWAHHREVAGRSVAEQEQWLVRAEEHGWSRAQLRAAMLAAKALTSGGGSGLPWRCGSCGKTIAELEAEGGG